jgi:hypothetical protein
VAVLPDMLGAAPAPTAPGLPPFRVDGAEWLVRRMRVERTAAASRPGTPSSRARSGLIFSMRAQVVADEPGGQAQEPIAQRVRLGLFEVVLVIQAEQAAPAASGGQLSGQHPPTVHQPGFDGRSRRPSDLSARTLSSTTACWRCSTSMNWAWYLPGTPPIPRGGDVGDDDGVSSAGDALEGGQVPSLLARRLGAAHDPPQPIRPALGPAEQVGDLRDVLVVLDHPVLVDGGLSGGRQQPDGLLRRYLEPLRQAGAVACGVPS